METKNLGVVPATIDNVKPYGELIEPGTSAPTVDTELFNFWNDLSIADSPAPVSFGLVYTKHGKRIVPALERHVKTSETMVPLDADIAVVLGTPGKAHVPDPETVAAFRIPRGTGITLKRGTWHYVPLSTTGDPCRTLVAFRQNTPSEDLELKELADEFGFEYEVVL